MYYGFQADRERVADDGFASDHAVQRDFEEMPLSQATHPTPRDRGRGNSARKRWSDPRIDDIDVSAVTASGPVGFFDTVGFS